MLSLLYFYSYLQKGSLLAITAIACAFDVRCRRIPNALILTGFALGLLLNLTMIPFLGIKSIASTLLGILIPLVPGFILFVLHMAGAGDIKLLAAVGALIGRAAIGRFTWASLLVAACISLYYIFTKRNGFQSMITFGSWVRTCIALRAIIPYFDEETPFTFPFALPVFITAILYCSGLLWR